MGNAYEVTQDGDRFYSGKDLAPVRDMYIFLQDGDTIEEGDEVHSVFEDDWKPYPDEFIGKTYIKKLHFMARRKQ